MPKFVSDIFPLCLMNKTLYVYCARATTPANLVRVDLCIPGIVKSTNYDHTH